MTAPANKKKPVITPVFRGAFLNLFEARAMQNQDGSQGKPKFGLTAIWDYSKFTDGDKLRWKAMAGLMDEACMAKFKKPYSAFKDLGNFKKAIRKGEEKPDLNGFGPGTYFASLTTQRMPSIVDKDGNPIGPAHGNAHLVYPGAYFQASVNAYGYDNKGKGVAIGLMNLRLVGNGPRLDSYTTATEDFDGETDMGWLSEQEKAMDDEVAF